MSDVKVSPSELMRADLRELKPYQSHVIPGNVKLDANENPFPWPAGLKERLFAQEIPFNRYPDGEASELREAIARYTGVPEQGILTGNGSDELIQVILATFGGVGRDLLIHPPTFSMYAAAAKVTGTGVREVPLISSPVIGPEGETLADMRLDVAGILQQAQDERVNIIIICNPNNPSGSLFAREDILTVVRQSGKMVVVDEAYCEFSGESLVSEIPNYPNLIVMRTFSKAFAMASLRLGYILAQESTIQLINRVRQPFNVNAFTQKAGTLALDYLKDYQAQIAQIKQETAKLLRALVDLPGATVYKTQANFVLCVHEAAERWCQELSQKGYSVRYMGDLPVAGKCLRVTAGLPQENDGFIKCLKEIVGK